MLDETDSPPDWRAFFRRSLQRLREEGGIRASFGPSEGPGGPYVTFADAGPGRVRFESDAGETLELFDDDAIAAAEAGLRAWGLVEADPLVCFVVGIDRDPADDAPYDVLRVLDEFERARRRRRSLSLVYDAQVGAIELDVSYPSRRWAELTVVAPKPVNAAQAQRLRELGLEGNGARWSGRKRATADELEAVVPSTWSRVRDVAVKPSGPIAADGSFGLGRLFRL